jgi:signal transduction histidine kinase
MTLLRALLIIVALVVSIALLPVSVVVRQQTRRALDQRMRDDLTRAPRILEDRWAAVSTVRMMHARDLAGMPGLSGALQARDIPGATRILMDGVAGIPEVPALFDSAGERILGTTAPAPELIAQTRSGGMPVSVVGGESGLEMLALAPIMASSTWLGAAGGATPMDDGEAQTLAGLTDTDVIILAPSGSASGSALDETATAAVAPLLFDLMRADTVVDLRTSQGHYLATSGELPGGVKVFFLRDVDQEMAILPVLQRSILISSGLALVFAMVLGGLFATGLARPVGSLAAAADRFRAGDIDAPLPDSRITEVGRLSAAFSEMRGQLAARLRDLESANFELEDRQQRLASLQAELVQRERRLATGQLVTQLAHEIRNPVASIRNCLEVILQETKDSEKAQDFAVMAIDELLRMHELIEQMLAMNRPRGDAELLAAPARVAHDVGRLVSAGHGDAGVSVVGDDQVLAAIPQDGLKQVFLNLIINAREASQGGPVEVLVNEEEGRVVIRVLDRGPGVEEDLLVRVFDPFFTTKAEVQGVGLGLFIAEAIVRRYNGSIHVENRDDGPGARFVLSLPIGGDA